MPVSPPQPAASELAQEIAGLLELRQSTALPPFAAVRLAALYGATVQRVLRVFPIEASRAPDQQRDGYAVAAGAAHIDEPPVPIGDEDLDRAIRTRRPVRGASGAGRYRLLVPLAFGDEVRHVIELTGTAANGHGSALAETLLPLLSGYYDLLADAETDPLTGLANRRLFYSQVGAGMAHLAAGPRKRFLALADIDNFKQINDRFGHLYGDEILIHFARLLRKSFRAGDLVYRFGGEEFVIVFAVEHADERGIALERFRSAVEGYEFPRVGRVTASVGFAALDSALTPATTFVDRADSAVYFAKRNGRNRVCEYEALLADGSLQAPKPEAGGEATLF
jgi:diguanylate cyclase (GGDEF)-like protein